MAKSARWNATRYISCGVLRHLIAEVGVNLIFVHGGFPWGLPWPHGIFRGNADMRGRKSENSNIYRVSQEECARLRESVPHVKVYRYNSKHLYPKLNGYGDNGLRKVRGFLRFQTLQPAQLMRRATALMTLRVECSVNRACVTVSCLYGSWKRHVKCLEP